MRALLLCPLDTRVGISVCAFVHSYACTLPLFVHVWAVFAVFTAIIISLSAVCVCVCACVCVCVCVCVCFSMAAPQITSVEYQNLFASPSSTSTAGRIGMISRLRDQ